MQESVFIVVYVGLIHVVVGADFVGGDGGSVHLAPYIGDVGDDKGNKYRHYRHGLEGEEGRRAVGDGERALKVGQRGEINGVVVTEDGKQRQNDKHGADAAKPDATTPTRFEEHAEKRI